MDNSVELYTLSYFWRLRWYETGELELTMHNL